MRLNCPPLLLLTLCTTAATTLAQRLWLPDTPGIDLKDNPDCAVSLACWQASIKRTAPRPTRHACARMESFSTAWSVVSSGAVR
ncbi:hypothetical protein CGRA01v4_13437 [Colletotrichum graminicola]|nr:hypothetical protein CGRA01v4_13437 [Colletotrichum graminicola]